MNFGVIACHNCKVGPSRACFTCRRVSQDDIRIAHTPHNRSEMQIAANYAPSAKATNLPDEDEDALRKLLATVAGLDVLQFIAALHMARHGRCRHIAKAVRDAAEDVRSYYSGEAFKIGRATVQAKWHALCRKIPELAAVQAWRHGHGGRKRAEA